VRGARRQSIANGNGDGARAHLVTGGAGFIGSHLAEALVARGDRVLILDDLSTGRPENVEHLLEVGGAELIRGSVADEALVDDCMRAADTCFHLAAPVGVKLIIEQPLESLVAGVRGTQTVIEAASRLGRPLLFASTSEVYGKNGGGPLREDADRIVGSTSLARWNYSAAKAFGESLAFCHHRERGARTVVVRLFNTVGPRQLGVYGMVLPRFVRQALAGEELTVYGDGSQSRCFTHVDDTIDALIRIADCEFAVGEAYNVGCPVQITILDLAERVIARSGSASAIRLVPYESAYGDGFEELGTRRPDISRVKKFVGWEPTRTVDDAIDDLIAYERGEVVPAETVASADAS